MTGSKPRNPHPHPFPSLQHRQRECQLPFRRNPFRADGQSQGAHRRRSRRRWPIDRFVVVGGIGILIRPRAAVPMSEKQDSALCLRIKPGEKIARLQVGAVESFQHSPLLRHVGAMSSEFGSEPVATEAMRLRVGHTRIESHLPVDVGIGAVGIESHLHRGLRYLSGGSLRGLLSATSGQGRAAIIISSVFCISQNY